MTSALHMAGHDLDTQIASCVFDGITTGAAAEPYSTSIVSAWKIVERMRLLGYEMHLHSEIWGKGMPSVPYQVWFYNRRDDEADDRHGADAETAPHCICLAALKAVGAIRQG